MADEADKGQRPFPDGAAPVRGGGQKDPIALGLRRLWAGVEQEDVPDDFLRLLDQIDESRDQGNRA